MPPLTERDVIANDMSDMFDFSQAPLPPLVLTPNACSGSGRRRPGGRQDHRRLRRRLDQRTMREVLDGLGPRLVALHGIGI